MPTSPLAYAKWPTKKPQHKNGIIVASDSSFQWLLPWWWQNYNQHNSLPVTFVDMGMDEKAKAWCQERGNLVPLSIDSFVTLEEDIPPKLVNKWHKICDGNFWPARDAWFKKPLAMLLTLYQKTLWLDLDCEIKGPVDDIFEMVDKKVAFGCVREPQKVQLSRKKLKAILPDETLYNSGVCIYMFGTPLIQEWAKRAILENSKYLGDQELLSRIIYQKKYKTTELPPTYNWIYHQGPNADAKIYHWLCGGKQEIIKQITHFSQLIFL